METIAEIREKLQNCPASELQEWLREYEQDSRKGVQKLLDGFWRKQAAQLKEEQRLDALLSYERQCYAEGYELVAGIDEVGRGPLAGPVVAAAVILPGCPQAGPPFPSFWRRPDGETLPWGKRL